METPLSTTMAFSPISLAASVTISRSASEHTWYCRYQHPENQTAAKKLTYNKYDVFSPEMTK